MCGRFSNTLGPEEIARQVARQLGVGVGVGGRLERMDGMSVRNIAPTEQVLGFVAPGSGGRREARMLRWALLADWAQDLKGRPQINARIETVRKAGKFIGVPAEAAHRALIPATEFIEWSKAERRATSRPAPFGFSVQDGRAFCFAGLWSTNEHVADAPIDSCTNITCDARGNSLVAPLHDRMPVIFADAEGWEAWLDPSIAIDEALSLCEPFPAERMSVRPLSERYNDAREKEPEGKGPELDGPELDGPELDGPEGQPSQPHGAGEQLTLGT
ncbi:MAG: SOS response-associated peptidase [Solirubrobacteraceae bacterium]